MTHATTAPQTAVIILAGGKSTRMRSARPKVLHQIAGWPMVHHVCHAAEQTGAVKTVAIVGHKASDVEEAIHAAFPAVECVLQAEQLGTGHAVQQAQQALAGFTGNVIILCGDVPLVTGALLADLTATHTAADNTVTVVTTTVDDPTALGRIIRDDAGHFAAIIEEKDATAAQRTITEINTGIYMAKAPAVFELLAKVSNNNASGEFYLTDIAALAHAEGLNVGTHHTDAGRALLGVNTRIQLAEAEGIYQHRRRQEAMANDVTMLDPQTVYFSHDTVLGGNVMLGPNIRFLTGVTVGDDVTIEGNCVLEETTVGPGCNILSFCHISGAELADNVSVGPFARLRTGTVMGTGSKVGNFCELKKATLGPGSKMGHLSYAGDATIGRNVNIGAGTITCNYDGTNKHHTTIEDEAFIGSNTSLIAPVTIGHGAVVGAGSAINKDIPAASLGVTRGELKIRADWPKPCKKGA